MGPGRAPRAALCRVAPVYLARVEGAGYGLFARERLRAGEPIGEYAGVLTKDWARDVSCAAEIDPYLLKFPFDPEYAIDAEEIGNETRFINHSTRANVRRVYLSDGGLPRVIFTAAEDIPAGRQILLDYGKGYWLGRTPRRLTDRGGGGATRPKPRT